MVRLALCLLVASALAGCSSSFPAVKDPATLIKDCDALLAGGQNRMVPAEQWPASIQALRPAYVCVNDADVMIAIETGEDAQACGYFVSHAPPFAGRRKLIPTADPGIYRFQWAQ